MVQCHIVKILHLNWVSISALEHCRKMKFRIQLHLTLINSIIIIYTVYKYCHASVNLDNVDVLYLENGNVDRPRPVLKNKTATFFLKNFFSARMSLERSSFLIFVVDKK